VADVPTGLSITPPQESKNKNKTEIEISGCKHACKENIQQRIDVMQLQMFVGVCGNTTQIDSDIDWLRTG
jgi:hypothetical protein